MACFSWGPCCGPQKPVVAILAWGCDAAGWVAVLGGAVARPTKAYPVAVLANFVAKKLFLFTIADNSFGEERRIFIIIRNDDSRLL